MRIRQAIADTTRGEIIGHPPICGILACCMDKGQGLSSLNLGPDMSGLGKANGKVERVVQLPSPTAKGDNRFANRAGIDLE